MDECRRKMMDQLVEDQPDIDLAERASQEMGDTFAALEKATFDHMLALMEIGDDRQREKYKHLIRDIMEQMRPPGHKGGPPHGQRPSQGKSQPPPRRQQESSDQNRYHPPGRQADRETERGETERSNSPQYTERSQRRQRPGQQDQGTQYLNRLERDLNLSPQQVEQIRSYVTATFQKLQSIPNDPNYRGHHERRTAAETLFQAMNQKIRAILTEEQKQIFSQMETHRPPKPLR
jgi:hypothetical protein